MVSSSCKSSVLLCTVCFVNGAKRVEEAYSSCVSFGKKALIAFGFLYLFLPIDLIPAPVFFVAWVDDLILWIFILHTLREELDRYGKDEKEVELNEKFHGKNVIDDVEFNVEEELDPEDPSAAKKQQ